MTTRERQGTEEKVGDRDRHGQFEHSATNSGLARSIGRNPGDSNTFSSNPSRRGKVWEPGLEIDFGKPNDASLDNLNGQITLSHMKSRHWVELQRLAQESFALQRDNRRHLSIQRKARIEEISNIFEMVGLKLSPQCTEQQLLQLLKTKKEQAEAKEKEVDSRSGFHDPRTGCRTATEALSTTVKLPLRLKNAEEVSNIDSLALPAQPSSHVTRHAKEPSVNASSTSSASAGMRTGPRHATTRRYGNTTMDGGHAVFGDVNTNIDNTQIIYVVHDSRSSLEVLAASLIGSAAGAAAHTAFTGDRSQRGSSSTAGTRSPDPYEQGGMQPVDEKVGTPVHTTHCITERGPRPAPQPLSMNLPIRRAAQAERAVPRLIGQLRTAATARSGPTSCILLIRPQLGENASVRGAEVGLDADLKSMCDLVVIGSVEVALQHLLGTKQRPSAILVADSILLDAPTNHRTVAMARKVNQALERYTNKGGTVVYLCQYVKSTNLVGINRLFADLWELPWSVMVAGEEYQTDERYCANPYMHRIYDMVRSTDFSMTAVRLNHLSFQELGVIPRTLLRASNREGSKFSMDMTCMDRIWYSSVAIAQYGRGRLGWIGTRDLKGTTRAILAAMLNLNLGSSIDDTEEE